MSRANQAARRAGWPDTLAYAQAMLNSHPGNSPFWDSSAGQDVLAVAKQNNLKATNTNRERAAIHADAMRTARASLNVTPEIAVELINALEVLVLRGEIDGYDPILLKQGRGALAKVQA